MAYQGLLLSDRRRLRTESIEEHATPNSSPAQWPGENLSVFFFFCLFKSSFWHFLFTKLLTGFVIVVICGFDE